MKRRGVVRIDAKGGVVALDAAAAQELGARKGDHALVPAPPEYVILRKLPAKKGETRRACRLSGEISTPGALCDIVALIGYARWRGELVVLDGTNNRSLFFDSDSVVSARSTAEQERLGRVLYRRGALSRDQVMQAAKATKDGVRFGEAIVELGFLTSEELFRLMETQAREVFDAAIRVERGAFYFFDGFDDARLAFRLRCPVSSMLTDAVRRMDEMKYFRERIPSANYIPVRVQGRLPDGKTNRLYPVVDGQRSVGEICRVVRSDELEVTRALFELAQAGYISIDPPRTQGPRAIVEVFNQAMSIVMRELDAVGAGQTIRQQLAAFAAGGGAYAVLFAGAGPAPDGTLNAVRIEQNFKRLASQNDSPRLLSEWLHDYASYALFLARPHLERAESGKVDSPERRLSHRLRLVLAPIAPLKRK